MFFCWKNIEFSRNSFTILSNCEKRIDQKRYFLSRLEKTNQKFQQHRYWDNYRGWSLSWLWNSFLKQLRMPSFRSVLKTAKMVATYAITINVGVTLISVGTALPNPFTSGACIGTGGAMISYTVRRLFKGEPMTLKGLAFNAAIGAVLSLSHFYFVSLLIISPCRRSCTIFGAGVLVQNAGSFHASCYQRSFRGFSRLKEKAVNTIIFFYKHFGWSKVFLTLSAMNHIGKRNTIAGYAQTNEMFINRI